MAGFRPKSTGKGGNSDRDFESFNMPVPRAGNRKGRVSLIIDLGTQDREDFEDPVTKEKRPQNPCQQVLVFADLVNDVVDYGGKIGKQQYRMALHKVYQQVPVGINFATTPPKDAKGNTIQGKPWSLHPANLLTKLAKAVDMEHIIYEDRTGKNPDALNIELLLDKPFMCQVEVKESPAKDDKKDKDGNPIVYKNVNFKGAAPVPLDDNDEPMPVAELTQKARCITFDNATEEDIQFIRPSILKLIKKANDYAGSQMQAAIEAYEATNAAASSDDEAEEEQKGQPQAEKKPAPAAKKAPAAAKKKPASAPEEDDDDAPF